MLNPHSTPEQIIVEVDPWLTVNRCAMRGDIHPSTVRRMIKAGILRHARVGTGRINDIRIRASWFDAAIEAQATPLEQHA